MAGEKKQKFIDKLPLPSFLKKDVSFKELGFANQKNQEIVSKDTMNLYQKEVTDNSPSRVLPLAGILIVLFIVFFKFGIYDRLAKLNDLESQLATSRTQLEEYQAQLKDYGQVKEKYYRYTDAYKSADEKALMDRVRIVELIASATNNLGTVTDFSITGTKVTAVVVTSNLDQVSSIRKNLEGYKEVSDVTVYSATKRNGNSVVVNSSIVFTIKDAQ